MNEGDCWYISNEWIWCLDDIDEDIVVIKDESMTQIMKIRADFLSAVDDNSIAIMKIKSYVKSSNIRISKIMKIKIN